MISSLLLYFLWTPKTLTSALECLPCLTVGLPSTDEDSTEAGGHSYTDPSAVAQLEQCKFIKENKRRNSQSWPRYCVVLTCSLCKVLIALDGLHWNIRPRSVPIVAF